MNKKDFYTFYFYIELIGTIIVTMFLYYNTYWYFSSIKYAN